jgi:hypothetical protein
MKVYIEQTLENFKAWSGAKDTKDRIIEEGKEDAFESLIEELYPDGIEDGQLNDLLWFEADWIFESLGIEDEEEEDEEEEDEE